jgi:hypothetical protein
MEIVSELLGHSKISVTQASYAKIVNKKVSAKMDFFLSKLKQNKLLTNIVRLFVSKLKLVMNYTRFCTFVILLKNCTIV